MARRAGIMGETVERYRETTAASTAGRWPSNVVLTHSPTDPEDGCEPSCPVAELDAQSGHQRDGVAGPRSGGWGRFLR
jgi:hypothetical protein